MDLGTHLLILIIVYMLFTIIFSVSKVWKIYQQSTDILACKLSGGHVFKVIDYGTDGAQAFAAHRRHGILGQDIFLPGLRVFFKIFGSLSWKESC